jgi:hypothetical protein
VGSPMWRRKRATLAAAMMSARSFMRAPQRWQV